jgi:hypothetical protein
MISTGEDNLRAGTPTEIQQQEPSGKPRRAAKTTLEPDSGDRKVMKIVDNKNGAGGRAK